MKYPIAIEPGSEKFAYGVVIPDLPGCFSAGDTLEEAYSNAKEAAELWLETQIDDGAVLPRPSKLETVAKNPDFKGWYIGFIDLDLAQLTDKRERINITLPARILQRLDRAAKDAGTSRSGFVAQLVLARTPVGTTQS